MRAAARGAGSTSRTSGSQPLRPACAPARAETSLSSTAGFPSQGGPTGPHGPHAPLLTDLSVQARPSVSAGRIATRCPRYSTRRIPTRREEPRMGGLVGDGGGVCSAGTASRWQTKLRGGPPRSASATEPSREREVAMRVCGRKRVVDGPLGGLKPSLFPHCGSTIAEPCIRLVELERSRHTAHDTRGARHDVSRLLSY